MTSMSTSKKAAPPEPKHPERFLIFLRHGIAEDATEEKKDEDRSLTSEGHAKMKQIARGLERAFPKAQAIYASPLLRTIQTALWVSKAYRSRMTVNTTDALAPGATRKQFQALIASIDVRRAIIVGHEPTLTAAVRALTGLEASQPLELKKGGCYGVRLNADGTAVLEWLLPPRVLRELGR
jgi:phosphohistidine phosphatase